MKIGKYNRQVIEFAESKRLKPQDVKLCLLLNDVMWMSYPDIRHYLAATNQRVFTSVQLMLDRKCIKLARRPNGQKGITKMYSLTNKGRSIAEQFLTIINN